MFVPLRRTSFGFDSSFARALDFNFDLMTRARVASSLCDASPDALAIASMDARVTLDERCASSIAPRARARAVAHFGVGNELLVCNLDANDAREAPQRESWSAASAVGCSIARATAEALFALREREVRREFLGARMAGARDADAETEIDGGFARRCRR